MIYSFSEPWPPLQWTLEGSHSPVGAQTWSWELGERALSAASTHQSGDGLILTPCSSGKPGHSFPWRAGQWVAPVGGWALLVPRT